MTMDAVERIDATLRDLSNRDRTTLMNDIRWFAAMLEETVNLTIGMDYYPLSATICEQHRKRILQELAACIEAKAQEQKENQPCSVRALHVQSD